MKYRLYALPPSNLGTATVTDNLCALDLMNWLEALLSAGEVLQENVKEQAEDREFSWTTVKRAKKKLGVKSTKHRFYGKWTWKLPDAGQDLRYMAKVDVPVQIRTGASITEHGSAILKAMVVGEITPSEAATLMQSVSIAIGIRIIRTGIRM